MAKADVSVNSTRPDLSLMNRPGAFVIQGNDIVPDMTDEAMKVKYGKKEEIKTQEVIKEKSE